MYITSIWIICNCLIFAWIGLVGLYNPAAIAKAVGLNVSHPVGLVEIRATYGGCMIAIASVLTFLVYQNEKNIALQILIFLYAGFGFGRLMGVLLNKTLDPTSMKYLICEWLGFFIGLVFIWSKK